MRNLAKYAFPAAAIVAVGLPPVAAAGVISAGGNVFVSGGTCFLTSTSGFYEERCTDGLGTDARALASVGPGGALPTLGALAEISSPPSSVGAVAEAIAQFEDTMSFAAGVATVSFDFDIDGAIATSGTAGDGPSAYFEFQAPGAFTFQEFPLGATSTTLTTIDIPISGGTLAISLLLKALAAAPGGGVQSTDFSSTLTISDVIQRDVTGNRVFTPILSELGFSYNPSTAPMPEPGSGWLVVMGLIALRRSRRRS